jgi:anti-anti-sigma regulatory factor
MPFELTVATKVHPRESRGVETPPSPTRATLVLSGELDAAATVAIVAAIERTQADGVASIVVEFDAACTAQTPALQAFEREIMALRERGVEVQVAARGDALHERMNALAQSRDWLLTRGSDASSAARKALHVDGASER